MTRPAKDAPRSPRRASKRESITRPWWIVRSDKAICSQGCGARCCKASFISLTPKEAEHLPKLAQRLGLPELEIVPNERSRVGGPDGPVQELIMYAQPCIFLSKNNLCQAYAERPAHCKAFPDQAHDWCPLSWKRFGEG